MWQKILVAGASTVAGSLIFGASLVGAQAVMPSSDQTPVSMSVPNSDPSTLATAQCDALWYGCQGESGPWDHPNSGTEDTSVGDNPSN